MQETEKSPNTSYNSSIEIAKAKAKAAAQSRRSQSCLVPLQPQGKKRPFFCIHPQAGVVFPYYELAFLLGEERPFYALQSVGIASNEPPLSSVERMAACYIKAIQTVQPNGPYLLGGWSFGGIIAFEMARQLQQAGQGVSLLVSIDTTANSASKLINIWDVFRFVFTSALRNIWPYVFEYLNLNLLAAQNEKRGDRPQLQSTSRTAQVAKAIALNSKRVEFRQAAIRRLFPVIWANAQALINYKPQIYPGRMLLLRSKKPMGNLRRDPTLGWGALAQEGVDIHEIPGHHLNILLPPNVKILAETLKACLDGVKD